MSAINNKKKEEIFCYASLLLLFMSVVHLQPVKLDVPKLAIYNALYRCIQVFKNRL